LRQRPGPEGLGPGGEHLEGLRCPRVPAARRPRSHPPRLQVLPLAGPLLGRWAMTQAAQLWRDFNDAPDLVVPPARLNVDEIRQDLLANLPATLEWLLPQGQVKGREFVVGDVDGNPGESLSVALEGPKAGMWFDFATRQ